MSSPASGPIVFPALSSGGPDIYLQHVGSDAHSGWHAFDAQAAGEDRTCTLKWRAATRRPRPIIGNYGNSAQDRSGAVSMERGEVFLTTRSLIV